MRYEHVPFRGCVVSTVKLTWQPESGPAQTVTVLHVSPVLEAAIAAAVDVREGDDAVLRLPQVVAEEGRPPEPFVFRAWRVLSYRVVGP